MARSVLVAAPVRIARKLADAIGDRLQVQTCTDPEKAMALASTRIDAPHRLKPAAVEQRERRV